jgi:hypothetical protein
VIRCESGANATRVQNVQAQIKAGRSVGNAGATKLDGGPGNDTSPPPTRFKSCAAASGTQFDPVVVRTLCAEVDSATLSPVAWVARLRPTPA